VTATALVATLVAGAATSAHAARAHRTPLPPSTVPAPAGATIRQPAQRTSGPGGSGLAHAEWRESAGGTGADAWYVFEPIEPQPRSAPVAVIMHGYYEFAGYATMYELIRHTVQSGSIVVYPRWQTEIATPGPGPFDIEPCMQSTVRGIRDALAFLRADPDRVQPRTKETSYLGLSFGGIITANLANRYERLGVPRPRAIFLDDPHDGGLNGFDEGALDDSMRGIPKSTLVECHVGAEGVIAEANKANGSCNSLFPKLRHIPKHNKALVLTYPDDHGQPALSSRHGVCGAPIGRADAYDWNFCWKVWDALRSAAIDGRDRAYALGDTRRHRSNGKWSDGTPIKRLKFRTSARIRP
jgi:hypothetical protein